MGESSNPISLSFPLTLYTALQARAARWEENSLYALPVADFSLVPIAAK